MSKNKRTLPRGIKVCGIMLLWIGITSALASALYAFEIRYFGYAQPNGWRIDFCFFAYVTGAPLLLAVLFSSKRLPMWAKVAIAVPCLFIIAVMAAFMGLWWLVSYMHS